MPGRGHIQDRCDKAAIWLSAAQNNILALTTQATPRICFEHNHASVLSGGYWRTPPTPHEESSLRLISDACWNAIIFHFILMSMKIADRMPKSSNIIHLPLTFPKRSCILSSISIRPGPLDRSNVTRLYQGNIICLWCNLVLLMLAWHNISFIIIWFCSVLSWMHVDNMLLTWWKCYFKSRSSFICCKLIWTLPTGFYTAVPYANLSF